MRLSHSMQFILNALQSWKIACGTNVSAYLFSRIRCHKIRWGKKIELVFSRRSCYTNRCRTSGLDGSTATGPLLSATRGDPASSSVRRWVETARREEDADEGRLSTLDWSAAG